MFCTTLEQAVLTEILSEGGLLDDTYLGLICGGLWLPDVSASVGPSVAVAVGQYAVSGTEYGGDSPTNRHVYICTTAGTTGDVEPTWDQGRGATTEDGSAVWTECSERFHAGVFDGCEPADDAYARQPTTYELWSAVGSSDPASASNLSKVQYPAATLDEGWGWGLGAFFVTAAEGGTPQAALLANVGGLGALNIGSAGLAPFFDVGQLSVQQY